MLIGWFFHPISTEFGGYLQTLLSDLTLGMPAATKVLLLDGILILAIGAQWWLVGVWLRSRERANQSVEFQRKLAIATTVGGIVSATLCRAGMDLDFIAALAAFGSAILWLIMLSNGLTAGTKTVLALFYRHAWVKLKASG